MSVIDCSTGIYVSLNWSLENCADTIVGGLADGYELIKLIYVINRVFVLDQSSSYLNKRSKL